MIAAIVLASLTLLGHTDVVPVDRDAWSVDPFEGVVRDGYVWGRGALDMLNITASQAVAFKTLARRGWRPGARSLDEDTRTRVLLAGLRALDGRTPEPAVG